MFSIGRVKLVALGVAAAVAVGACSDSGTTPDPQPPAAPTGVTVSLANGQVTVAWSASTGATSYRVQRRVSGTGAAFADVAANVTATTYTDSAITAGNTYQYQVIAVNADGNSSASALAEVVVPVENRTAVLSGTITGNRQLSADTVYKLQGIVTVEDGGELHIPAGTMLQGDVTVQPTALIVRVGGKIFAEGTESNPVIFTSSRVGGSGSNAPTAGDWGGLVINGESQCNFPASECVGEGSSGQYGGNVLDDDSGVLKYARIEYAGFEVSFGNELNGLTLNGVGSGTEIHHVQVHEGLDDGVELFGGTVDIKYMIVTDASDDSFDWSTGWSGNGQYWIVQQDPDDADNGYEVDGNEDDFTATPLTNPNVWNTTVVGKGATGTAGESTTGMLLRRGTGGMVMCAVVVGFGTAGLDVDNAETITNGVQVGSTILFDNAVNISTDSDGFQATVWAAGAGNQEADPMLADPYNRTDPDFRPDASGPAASGCAAPPAGSGLDTVDYIGAVEPGASSEWYAAPWTRWGDPNAG
ncbi:MAG: fibronectin type III domain-containing protein [Gemmatimonadota bacterium]